MNFDFTFNEERLQQIVQEKVEEIKINFVPRYAITDALKEIDSMICIEDITDSSGDHHGHISDYERGLADAAGIFQKHIQEAYT